MPRLDSLGLRLNPKTPTMTGVGPKREGVANCRVKKCVEREEKVKFQRAASKASDGCDPETGMGTGVGKNERLDQATERPVTGWIMRPMNWI
jgi:hypothetical protein